MSTACPGCGAANPTDNHLITEYLDLMKHASGRIFGQNAERAMREVGDALLGRGVTEIPNLFLAIPVHGSKP